MFTEQSYPAELQALYAKQGAAHSPRFPAQWRPAPVVLSQPAPARPWQANAVKAGRYRVIGRDADGWHALSILDLAVDGPVQLTLPAALKAVELLLDRRPDMAAEPACRAEDRC